MSDNIKVNLDALEAFADQLEDRLAALDSQLAVPGVGVPMPVGGAPAWEGQALSDAYWYSTQDARALLDKIREVLTYSATATRDTARTYRGGDVHNTEQNIRIAQAIQSGQQVPGGTGGPLP